MNDKLSTEEMLQERPTPRVGDPEKMRRDMAKWFSARMPEAQDIRLTEFSIPEASGMSNITLIFDLIWQENGAKKSKACVARVKPPGGVLVFEEYEMALQYKAMQTVSEVVPVPKLLGLEQNTDVIGSEFYIMEKLTGKVPPDIPPMHMDGWVKQEATPQQREKLWWNGIDALCKVHTVDWHKSLDRLYTPNRGGESIGAQFLHKMNRYMEWAPDPSYNLSEYRRAMRWLYDYHDKNESCGLCWGDARMGNTMFDLDTCKVVALFDWEMTDLCNPIKDLAWWCTLDYCTSTGLNIPRLEGFPSEEETVRQWTKITGLDNKQFQYYKVVVFYYFGLILIRTSMSANNPDPVGSNFVTPMLKNALDELGASAAS